MSPDASATTDRDIDGVPLPGSVALPGNGGNAPWAGAWVGAWGGQLKHILVVERLAASGTVEVIYAIGDNPYVGIKRAWSRHSATVDGDTLTVLGAGFTARYTRTSSGGLDAVYTRGDIRAIARMTKADDILTATSAKVAWTPGVSEFVKTDLVEAGAPVKLEIVIYRPTEGNGPFPLAVINHGSTGDGTNPALFRETWAAYALALDLNARGYLVAFPQRRGRGKSDGLYDEGFTPDRRRYSNDPPVTIAGFERALGDLHAAIQALKARTDVTPGRVLLGGQSRGGILSVAYAGAHPDAVAGVVNFVGGWTNGRDKNAELVNGSLFERGARFPLPMLWLYGSNDPFYDLVHTRGLHARFAAAGGQGQFVAIEQPPGYGHYIINEPRLWRAPLEAYLAVLPR